MTSLFLISLLIFSINIVFCKEYNLVDPNDFSIKENTKKYNQEDEELLKKVFPCYGKEIDLRNKTWPFSDCFSDKKCSDFWFCNKDCLCEPEEPMHWTYTFKGIRKRKNPSFLENPLVYFIYTNRTEKILLENKKDTDMALLLDVEDDEKLKKYRVGDTIKIYEARCLMFGYGLRCSYDLYNSDMPELGVTHSLFLCKGEHRCERRNYDMFEDSLRRNSNKFFFKEN